MWIINDNSTPDVSVAIIISIFLIIFGGINLLINLEEYLSKHDASIIKNFTMNTKSTLYIYLLIFIGSVSYTIASYYHLKLKNWTFMKALLIAIPFVIIEYQFSIRGNMHARQHLNLNAVDIVLITMCFYFVNAWILNFLVLKQNVTVWREILSFVFIICAFLVTTQKRI
jgi:hypothetical protein